MKTSRKIHRGAIRLFGETINHEMFDQHEGEMIQIKFDKRLPRHSTFVAGTKRYLLFGTVKTHNHLLTYTPVRFLLNYRRLVRWQKDCARRAANAAACGFGKEEEGK